MSVVGFGGTTRANSSGERMLRAVLGAVARRGVPTRLFAGPALLALPHYEPDRTERNAAQTEFVDAIRGASGIVICSPGYHGGISGLVKNAIDLLEDLSRDRASYLEGRPVGLIVVAAGWQACGTTLSAMRDVVHALRGWPTPLGITVNTLATNPFGADGTVTDPAILQQTDLLAAQIVDFAASRRREDVAV
jgi:FMN reductase